MSNETREWLAHNIRVGLVSKYGPAWWLRGAEAIGMADGTHFDGPVPMDEVRKILAVPLVEGELFSQYTDADGNRQVVKDPERKAIIRADTEDILGIFKSGYKVHPYEEWTAGAVSSILDQGKGELQSKAVGLLRKGGQAFYQAVLPEVMEVNGYGYQPFIGAATSCDGSLASTFFTGDIATVCDNTMYAAIRGASSKLKVRHSVNSLGRIGEVRDALSLVYTEADEFGHMIRDLCDVKVTDADWSKFVDEIAPLPERKSADKPGRAYTLAESKRDALWNLYTADPKAAPWKGTAFGALQAVNTWNTWDRTVQGVDGGRMERYYSQLADGKGLKDDAATLSTLGRVLRRDLVSA